MKANKLIFGLVGLLMLGLSSCIRPIQTPDGGMGLPITLAKPSYQIPVFYSNQTPDFQYVELGEVKVEKEVELIKEQTKQGRMIDRGNSEDQKKALLEQLILQSMSKGATALVNVTYKYYTAATYQGFMMTGTAVQIK